MPGYPTVDRGNDFLIARFDGAVLDAKPWGRGHPSRGPPAAPPSGQEPADDAEEDPGPPSASALGYTPAQAAVLRQLRSLEVSDLPPLALNSCWAFSNNLHARPAMLIIEKEGYSGRLAMPAVSQPSDMWRQIRNPLALAHYANHPPQGASPNVMLAAYDYRSERTPGTRQVSCLLPSV